MTFDTFDVFIKKLEERSHQYKIFIWGTGVYGDLLGQYLNGCQIVWNGYYDNYSIDIMKTLNGKPVIPGADVDADAGKLFVLSMRNFEPVREQLIGLGIDDRNIFSLGTIEAFDEIERRVLGDEKLSEGMKKFHNLHQGESCFVIGNGPSLCEADLNTIYDNHMVSFACNFIYKAYESVRWRPDYYTVTDVVNVAKEIEMNHIPYVTENCGYLFSRSNGRLREYLQEYDNIRLFKYIYSESEKDYSFSSDCAKQVYIGYTVTYAMLQLAVYMGFKTIYLLGMDHQYSREIINGEVVETDVKNYSDLLQEDQVIAFNLNDQTTLAYHAAKKYADAHGIKIYNATRGGKLELFERVDFDSIFCQKE